MKPPKDFITECMADTQVKDATPEQFMSAFCSRCLNAECKRSSLRGLKWQQRMDRQIEALFSPTFADPSDPNYLSIASQDFTTFEKQKVVIDSWDHFEEANTPERFQKEEKKRGTPVIHKAELPAQQHGGNRLEDSVSQLAASRGIEVSTKPTQESEPVLVEPPEPVPEPVPEPQHVPEPEPVLEEVPKRMHKAPQQGIYNTKVPKGGILLEGGPRPQTEKKIALQPDPWAIPDKGKKTLVVRADTGEVVESKNKT